MNYRQHSKIRFVCVEINLWWFVFALEIFSTVKSEVFIYLFHFKMFIIALLIKPLSSWVGWMVNGYKAIILYFEVI